jgi:hypothetical protein
MTSAARKRLRLLCAVTLVALALEATPACTPGQPQVATTPPPLPTATSTPSVSAPAATAAPLDAGLSDDLDDVLRPRSFVRGVVEAGTERDPAGPEEVARDLDDNVLERRVFRQTTVGATAFPPRRLTWVLLRGRGRVKLQLYCQTQPRPASLDDRRSPERFDGTWSPAVRATFEGMAAAEGAPMRLATSADLGAMWACVEVVRTLRVTCRSGHVQVLASGATLSGTDVEHTKRWEPSASRGVAGSLCTMARDPVDGGSPGAREPPIRASGPESDLVFVEPSAGSPGVEWVYENSEGIRQAGAYRWMAPP